MYIYMYMYTCIYLYTYIYTKTDNSHEISKQMMPDMISHHHPVWQDADPGGPGATSGLVQWACNRVE